MASAILFLTAVWFASLMTSLPVTSAWEDACETEPVEVEIVREMTVEIDGRRRTVNCLARITLNKCEGTCESRVSPSVIHHPGYKKDCRCCREGRQVTRTIAMDECYENGSLVRNIRPTTQVTDLLECGCHACQN